MPERFGKYVLDELIAVGGMAEIFLARQQGPAGFEKRLVVKRILPQNAANPRFVQMFLDEARLVASLDHPNVVQTFELGEEGGKYYMAMEFVDGLSLNSLTDAAERHGLRLPIHFVAAILARAAAGLAYAHDFTDERGRPIGLVHRDVSPDNILVAFNGGVKLIDFGIAKAATNRAKTQTGAVKGKFAYMSPEQVVGNELDGRSDIFALGIVLYELATGVSPFGRKGGLAALSAIASGAVELPSSVEPTVPADLEAVIMRALAREPAARFQDARQMGRALEELNSRRGLVVPDPEIGVMASALALGHAEGLAYVRDQHRVFAEARPDRDGAALTTPGAHVADHVAGREHAPDAVAAGGPPLAARAGTVTINPIRTTVSLGRDAAAARSRRSRRTAWLAVGVAALATIALVALWRQLGPVNTATTARSGPVTADSGAGSPEREARAAEDAELAAALRALDDSDERRRAVLLTVTSALVGAEVLVGGERIGETPLSRRLPAGPCEVEVRQGGERWRQRLDLRPGEQREVRARLDVGQLVLEGIPEGVTCTLAGELLEAGAAATIYMKAGRHPLRCRDAAGKTRKKSVRLGRGEREVLRYPW